MQNYYYYYVKSAGKHANIDQESLRAYYKGLHFLTLFNISKRFY